MAISSTLKAVSPLADAVTSKKFRKFVSPLLGSLKRGGKIKKTGAYRLHKGEEVIPKGRTKRRGGKGR